MKSSIAACTLFAMSLPSLHAQSSTLPRVYSFTADPALPVAGPAVVKVIRDGPRELIEQTLPPFGERTTPFRTRLLYNFDEHTLYTQVLSDASVPCGLSTYTSLEATAAFDLISGGAEFLKEAMGTAQSKQVGTETIGGAVFRIMELTTAKAADGKARLWLAETGGYPVKMVSISPDGKQQTYFELKQLSFAKPPASTFNPPSGCVKGGTTSVSGAGGSASTSIGTPGPPPGTTGSKSAHAPPQAAPGEIKIQADVATNHEIVLAWAGTDAKPFRLERKTGQQPWTAIEPGTTPGVAIDRKIDAYGTYQYRVVAGTKISNVITAGPPPTGFATIAPRPDKHPDTALGRYISPVLDANGDPAAAFVYADPNGDGKFDDTQLMFVAWDRTTYRWKEPVFVATMGNFEPRPPTPCVSIARDAQTGDYGIVWVNPDNKRVHLALSKDAGATWTVTNLLTDTKSVSGPSLAFAGGQAFFTLALEGRGVIQYMSGGIDEEPSKWKSSPIPMLPGHNSVLRGTSLAIDDKGAPALAYWQKPANGNQWSLTFWRPAVSQPVKVADTGASTYPPDGVLLAFAGTQPRIVLDARLDKTQISSHYSVFSRDAGATWSQPVSIPDDGNQHLGGYMSFAVSADGARAAFAGDVAGGNFDRMQCSWPKLARSTDLASWTTCAPQGAQYKDLRTLWGSVIFSPSGLLYVLFQSRQTNPAQGLPAGLLIWGGK